MSAFTPEQLQEIETIKTNLRADFMNGIAALDQKYAAKASGFRAWIEKQDPLWVARHTASVTLVVTVVVVLGVLRLLGKI